MLRNMGYGLEFPPLTEFRNWLSMNDPDTILARNWGWSGCPIWQFLDGYCSEATVYRDGTWWPEILEDYVPGGYKLPSWAAEFVWLSDLYKPRVMTFGDALKLLDNPLFRPEYWDSGKTRLPVWHKD